MWFRKCLFSVSFITLGFYDSVQTNYGIRHECRPFMWPLLSSVICIEHRYQFTNEEQFYADNMAQWITDNPCRAKNQFPMHCAQRILHMVLCPDDLTMKDWCHPSNILQADSWRCLVVQIMFHAFMTSPMTSPSHKVGRILKFVISSSRFQLERRSNSQHIGNARGYGTAIFNFWYYFR